MEERLINYENQIENLIYERTNLLEEIEKNKSSSIQTIDNEKQTDDKLLKVNSKLKRVLQTFKDKIHRIVTEKPDLFTNVGEETTERFDHIIATVEYQAVQIDLLETEREQLEKQLRNKIQELQNSFDAYRNQMQNESSIKSQQLVSTTPPTDDISRSNIENYEKQIHQLQQKLSQNDDERTLLRERLNEVELEFRKTLDDRATTTNMYEEQLQSLIQERDALVQQHVLELIENQHEIEKLQEKLAQFQRSPIPSHADIPSNEDVQSLQKIIEQQSEELKDLTEKYLVISSQLELQDEINRQKKDTEEKLQTYENQIQHLIHQHENLVEELKTKTSSTISTIDNQCQTDDQQHDKLTQINIKLKRVLQTFKDKIHRIVTERPELFINISEDTSDRLDHLISTVQHQATQINLLQTDHTSTLAMHDEQLQTLIQERNALVEQQRLQSIDK
ncbi:unnamed protein product [Rotaria sp. Silwood2]|nr:unnamed protein product [Rotaria sp. Silwood2]